MLRRYWVLGFALWVAAAAMGQEPVRISGGVMAGQLLTRVEPVYPAIAQAAGVSGAVVLHAIVGADGLVKNLQVISGPEMLRGAAVDAVRHWTYKPYLLNGAPTPVDTVVTLLFHGGGVDGTASQDQDRGEGARGSDGMQASSSGGGQKASPQRPARISGGVMAGQILTKVAPVYPAEAKAKGISGSVVMRAVIGKDGVIEKLTVLSGPEELRASAVDAVSQWTYKPYLLNGEPTEVDTTLMVNYNLGRPAAAAGTGAAASGDELGAGDGPPLLDEAESVPELPGFAPGVLRVKDGMHVVKKVAPSYPADARAKGVQGTVLMDALIGTDGAVSTLGVVSGPVELHASAVKAVKQWKYKPYVLEGVPTAVVMRIMVNFNMRY